MLMFLNIIFLNVRIINFNTPIKSIIKHSVFIIHLMTKNNNEMEV